MPREPRHGRRFPAKHLGALDRLHGPQREPRRNTQSNSEDCIVGASRAETLDRLIAVLRELIDDHRANDIGINGNLIVVHRAASVSGQPCFHREGQT